MEDAYVLQLLEHRFRNLYLCHCGYSECEALHGYGPASRPNYILHYVTRGRGIYQIGERKYPVSEGQFFLIEPDTLTFYQADRLDPWSYLWIGFGGTDVPGLLYDLGLNNCQPVGECTHGEELKEIVFSMLRHTKASTENLYYLQGQLYHFFAVLAKGIAADEAMDDSRENTHLQNAICYIRNHYSQKITVEDIARHLALNRSYLYSLFKKNLGISPKEFLTKFRVSRGKELLILTRLSIEEIALDCGYSSALAFGKAFKQTMGMTPSHYRSRNRKDTRTHLISVQDELPDYRVHKTKYLKDLK